MRRQRMVGNVLKGYEPMLIECTRQALAIARHQIVPACVTVREPDGAAVRLLEIAAEHPQLLASKVRHVSETQAHYSIGKRDARSSSRK